MPKAVLSIAGSDSGGGAGIQADLKAFARAGVHGMTAITALTAQNTRAVTRVEPVAPEMIVAQVAAVQDDIGVDAVKIGMLGDAATIAAVVEALALLDDGTPVVLDPVMVAESGARLLDEAAVTALREDLLSLVTVATPNLAEAAVLAGEDPSPAEETAERADGTEAAERAGGAEDDADDGDVERAEELARAIHAAGARAVIVTGGHAREATDTLFDGVAVHRIPGETHPGGNAHGSGCTHSSTLAAELAKGASLHQAATTARATAGRAVRDGLQDIGNGPGPVNVLEDAIPLT